MTEKFNRVGLHRERLHETSQIRRGLRASDTEAPPLSEHEQKKAERRKANKEAKARLRGFWRPGPRVQVLSVAVVEGMAERTKKQRRRKAKLQAQLAERLAGVGQMPLARATDGKLVTLADAVSP